MKEDKQSLFKTLLIIIYKLFNVVLFGSISIIFVYKCWIVGNFDLEFSTYLIGAMVALLLTRSK